MTWLLGLLAVGVIPVLLDKTSKKGHFDFIDPYLRHAWMAVIIIYTAAFLFYNETVRDGAMRLYADFGIHHRELSYVVVAIAGAALFCIYWWSTGALLSERKNSSPVPLSAPPPVRTEESKESQSTRKATPIYPNVAERPAFTQQAVTPSEKVDKVAEEARRRQSLASKLRQEYLLSHDGLTPAEIAGSEVTQREAEWINGRLKEKGETWKIAPTIKPSTPASSHADCRGSRF